MRIHKEVSIIELKSSREQGAKWMEFPTSRNQILYFANACALPLDKKKKKKKKKKNEIH